MDLFALDNSFVAQDIIEGFSSLIWTERYSESGDVTLVVPNSKAMKSKLVEGLFLSTPESPAIMQLQTIQEKEGILTCTGKDLTDILAQRMFRNTWSVASDSWNLTGSAGHLLNYIILHMIGAGGVMDGSGIVPTGNLEVIPNLVIDVEVSGISLSIAVSYGVLYDAVKQIADLDNLGFKMYVTNPGVSYQVHFAGYRGLDRTSDQITNNVVVFESALDTFSDIEALNSIAGYKNNAWCWCAGITAQAQLGYASAPGASGLTGFSRRTLMVDASDVNKTDYATDAALKAVLDKRAANALANNNYVRLLDGKIVPQSQFTYGTHYGLGDVIELRNSTNVAQQARITEYIRAQDSTGETEYPTLSLIA